MTPDQPTLWDTPAPAGEVAAPAPRGYAATVEPRREGLARRSDPWTSHAAAHSIDPAGQWAVIMRALGELGEANRYEISRACGLTEYQAGRRLSELERDRLIRWTGSTRPGLSGRQQRVWAPVTA